jgi:carbonic anhydrase
MEDSPSHQDYVADKKLDLEIVKDDEAKPDTWD